MHDAKTLTKLEERFLKRVQIRQPEECWPWLGGHTSEDYGLFGGGELTKDANGYSYHKKVTAHRFAYILEYGDIPKGYVIDHLCRTPPCVNPRHLEAVTQQENLRRGKPNGRPSREFSEEEKINIKEGFASHGVLMELARQHKTTPYAIRKLLGISINVGLWEKKVGRPAISKHVDWHRHDGPSPSCMRWHPITRRHHTRTYSEQ